MKSILLSIYCIPCIWSLICMLGNVGVVSFIRNTWVPFRGPLPSDGPVEGFASKAARIEFYDTNPIRIRRAFNVGAIGVIIWMLGMITSLLILNSLS